MAIHGAQRWISKLHVRKRNQSNEAKVRLLHRDRNDTYGYCAGEATIDILSDDALLAIFFLYKEVYLHDLSWWEPLVHVCRRWRHLIFASPLHLNLTLVCSLRKRARRSLDIWPPFPIAIHVSSCKAPSNIFNFVAALKHPDRVSDIRLNSLTITGVMVFVDMMRCPFSVLTYLSLGSIDDDELVLPDGFLGGSAPSLRTLLLERIAFAALPKLLLSTTQLVTLRISSASTIGYISPGVMATCLVSLPNLKQITLKFPFPFPDPEQSSPPLPTRAVLPSLLSFRFVGVTQYLEDLLTQLDAPGLRTVSATFCDHVVHIPQFFRFTNYAKRLSGPPIRAAVEFEYKKVLIKFILSDGFELAVTCTELLGQVLSMALVCRELSPLVSRVERLDLRCVRNLLQLAPPFMNLGDWPELFQPFIAVKNVYLCKNLWPKLAPALQDLSEERVVEALPELRTLFLEEPRGRAMGFIEPFITARRLSGHPVAVQQCVTSDFMAKG